MRDQLDSEKIHPDALKTISHFHADIVAQVKSAVAQNEWVIIGMKGNGFVKKAAQSLSTKHMEFKYLEFGGYFSMWQQRLAIKIWSGWPTFPQVFHKGQLIGGCKDLQKYLEGIKN